MRAEGLRRLKDEPVDAAADEPISSIEVRSAMRGCSVSPCCDHVNIDRRMSDDHNMLFGMPSVVATTFLAQNLDLTNQVAVTTSVLGSGREDG
jgi:hypothetical protein